MASVELALDCKAKLGESPVCDASGSVYFVDINGKKIHFLDSLTGSHASLATTQQVGCIVPRSKGGHLAALEHPIVEVDVHSQHSGSEIASIPDGEGGPGFRFNDGKCDAAGRFWVGTMIATWRDPLAPAGRLYVLDADHSPGKLQERIYPSKLPNGLAWSSDNSKMFFVDSYLRTVTAFDYDLSSGIIAKGKTAVKISDSEPGPPDGMAIDATDKLWLVVGETGSVRQYDPETGVQILSVKLPVQRPTSCAFGGVDLSELYVTTREEKGPGASEHAGGLFKCHIPGVRGASFAVPYAG